MSRYDEVIRMLDSNKLSSKFTKLSSQELEKEVRENQNAPKDYIDFLKEVGYGDIGDGHYMIYSGLISSCDVYDDETSKELDGILFFGDDFNGYCGGFVTTDNWKLIEYGGGSEIIEIEMSFEEFIIDKLKAYMECMD